MLFDEERLVMLNETLPQPQGEPFAHYRLSAAYDEMFAADGSARPHYAALYRRLLELPTEELRRREQAAELSFLNQGITFTVYGRDEGTERIIPHDLLPRILTGAEWDVIERGLVQRITALNHFLRDIYHEGRILADGIVPRQLVYTCRHYRREMRGVNVPQNIYFRLSAPIWCGYRMASSPCWKTICACQVACPT